MKLVFHISLFLVFLCGPLSSFAFDTTVGENLGLDFYSRIDDTGNSMAQAILKQRLSQKGTYGSLGCNISWLDKDKIEYRLLDALTVGDYEAFMWIVVKKKIPLTTTESSRVIGCLVEKYRTLESDAYREQTTIEVVGSAGLYMDGDINNSDYDLVADISRINKIIFQENYDYNGTKNASNKALSDMFDGKVRVGPLILSDGTKSDSPTDSNTTASSTSPTATGDTDTGTTISPLPWTQVCRVGGSGGSAQDGLFGDGFFDGLSDGLAGAETSGDLTYTPPPSEGGTGSADQFGHSEASDYFDKNPCPVKEGDNFSFQFCITSSMTMGSSNLFGGFSNRSIESLLQKHSNMVDPIAAGDLSGKKMTNASFQLKSLGDLNLSNLLAGLHVYTINDVPQTKKVFPTDESQKTKDAAFEAAYRCAMNEAGLSGDSDIANGFIGAGFNGLKDTSSVDTKTMPLGPITTQELLGCYNIRMSQGKKIAYEGLTTDLGEIQSFTMAMTKIIEDIITADLKLDTLPVK